MNTAVNRIRELLVRAHHRSHGVLTGNATSALTLLLREAGAAGGTVAIPNNVCFSVPQAVLYADATPLFLDVTTSDAGLDPDHLRAHIGRVDAVIAVHAYGTPCRIEEIARICREHGVFLIEDLAVAHGATLPDGEPVGSVGDAAVVSFGAGKIIDVGHGGAVLTDDQTLAARVTGYVHSLPLFRQSMEGVIDRLSSFHTQLYNRAYVRGLGADVPAFVERLYAARDAFFYRFDPEVADRLLDELTHLSENVERRRARDRRTRTLIMHHGIPGISSPAPPDGAVPWRCNLYVEPDGSVDNSVARPAAARRGTLLRHLLDLHYRASSWQPSVDLFFRDRTNRQGGLAEAAHGRVFVRHGDGGHEATSPATPAPSVPVPHPPAVSIPATPVSDRIGDTILNLWVNDDVDDGYTTTVIDEIAAWVTTSPPVPNG